MDTAEMQEAWGHPKENLISETALRAAGAAAVGNTPSPTGDYFNDLSGPEQVPYGD